jgi:hypothetical protein
VQDVRPTKSKGVEIEDWLDQRSTLPRDDYLTNELQLTDGEPMAKTKFNWSTDDDTLTLARYLAEWQKRDVSNMLEVLVQQEYAKVHQIYLAGMNKAAEIYKAD